MAVKGVDRVVLAYVVFLGMCGFIFSSMTVTIEDDLLTVRFGLGIFRKRLILSAIESCEIVENPWYYGWGVRRIPGGWLFAVSGREAVEVIMKSGKRYRIGSDEPEVLAAAINSYINDDER